MTRRSYSSLPSGLTTRANEAIHLQRMHRRRAPERARRLIADMTWLRAELDERYGLRLDGRRILDVGGGQLLPNALYFAQSNDVVSIDQAFVPRPGHPFDVLSMLRRNGPVRMLKTVGRKALGVDRRFRSSLADELGLDGLRHPELRTMDAGEMELPDDSFDMVMSFSVFEHLDDPKAVVQEVVRVLRPGGVAVLHVHPYTSENGAHDPRIMSGDREACPLWAHLRPEHQDLVSSNAFLNEWRVARWRDLFTDLLPGCEVVLRGDDDPALREQLRTLRADGELAGYDDDELLNRDLFCFWRLPADGRPPT